MSFVLINFIILLLLLHLSSAQDFKSRFVQDDFLPIPLSAPLADSGEGELKQDPRCLQTHEDGDGADEIVRFYFNASNSSCTPFMYTGSGGNQNNFLTEIDCLNNCYIETNEGAPLKEEDVHMINQAQTDVMSPPPKRERTGEEEEATTEAASAKE